MPVDDAILGQIRDLAAGSPEASPLVRQMIETWAARRDFQVKNELLQKLVMKYAVAEKEVYRLHRSLLEKQQRIEEDLAAAAEIQKSLLPRSPALPERFDIAWSFEPCTHIAGDIFNLMQLDEDRWAFYALDVSGHGVPAAMVAVSVYQSLQPHSSFVRRVDSRFERGYELRSPGEVLQALDIEYPFERFSNFFTLVYMILDAPARTLTYGNAGHPHPVVLRRNGGLELLKRGGPFIGLRSIRPVRDKEKLFAEETVSLEPGDRLFLYTDGLIEYHNPEGQLFGRGRFLSLLQEPGRKSVAEAIAAVQASLKAFGRGTAPADDVTLVGIEVK
jgi:sigma-B regulation protein RsbU (phosphoserine phosphatase)